MDMDEYGKALADMAAEPLDIDEAQHFDELRRRYDTAAKKKARQAARRLRHKEAAAKAGFKTVDGLAAAINDPAVERIVFVRRDPEKA